MLNTSVAPVIFYRCPRWRWNCERANELDSMHFRMCSTLFRITQQSGETSESFGDRRAHEVNIARGKTWSTMWATQIANWLSHVHRHKTSVSYKMLNLRNLQNTINIERATLRQLVGHNWTQPWRKSHGKPTRFRDAWKRCKEAIAKGCTVLDWPLGVV
jgi:hypothetical protein